MPQGSSPRRWTRRRLLGAAATAFGIGAAVESPAGLREVRGALAGKPAAISVALLDRHAPRIQPFLDAFGRRTGIAVDVTAYSYDELYTQLTISLTQKTALYDLVELDDVWMPLFLDAGVLADLRDDEAEQNETAAVLPGLAGIGSGDSTRGVYGLPWTAAIKSFGWRRDLMPDGAGELPGTFDDVIARATQISAARGDSGLFGYGIAGQAGPASATSFLTMLRGYGGDLLDPQTHEPRLMTPVASAAMNGYLALAKHAPPGCTGTDMDEVATQLMSGAASMTSDIWSDRLFAAWEPEHGGIALAPGRAQPGRLPSSMIAAWLLAVPKQSPESRKAKELVRFLVSGANQKSLLLEQRMLPARAGILSDPDAIEQYPLLPQLEQAAWFARPRPRSPHYSSLEPILGRHVSEALAGQISGAAALIKAHHEMRDLLVREGVLE